MHVEVIIAEVADAEADHALTFHFPEAGLMIVQDLLYANAHAFPLRKADNWIASLEGMRHTEGLKVLGAGHGLPAAPGAIDDAITYLKFQNQVINTSDNAETAIATLTEAYPSYGGSGLLHFVNFRFQ